MGSSSRSLFLKNDAPRTTARSPRPPPPPLSGRQQLRKLQNDGIGLPEELTRVKLPINFPSFSAKIAPRHCLRRIDLQWFVEAGHPKGLLIAERCYDHVKTKPLWRSTLVSGGMSIVRGKAKARINMAFLQALSSMGYDADGKKVDPTKPHYPERVGNSSDAWRKKVVKLHGSLQIHSTDALGVLNRSFDQLCRVCEAVVRSMEEELGQTADGQKAWISDRARSSSGGSRQYQDSTRDTRGGKRPGKRYGR